MPGWACAIAVVGALLAAGPATAQGPRGIEVLGEALGSTLDPRAAAAAVAEYEHSWTHRALGLQEALARDVGLRDAPWVGTHNSFNSRRRDGPDALAADSNQKLTLADQLRMDVRSLELDVHWFPVAPRRPGQRRWSATGPTSSTRAARSSGCSARARRDRHVAAASAPRPGAPALPRGPPRRRGRQRRRGTRAAGAPRRPAVPPGGRRAARSFRWTCRGTTCRAAGRRSSCVRLRRGHGVAAAVALDGSDREEKRPTASRTSPTAAPTTTARPTRPS